MVTQRDIEIGNEIYINKLLLYLSLSIYISMPLRPL
jgi:hypothetical protein